MTRPKGVRVTVRRANAGRWLNGLAFIQDPANKGEMRTYTLLRKAGVPPLRPGESVTGRMVFVPEKKKGAK